jgi:uncharacterized damage-inducible protein DinB
MDQLTEWRRIIASSLNWEQAHATLDSAIKDLPADLRGRTPDNYPHTIWQLLDHIRRTQFDLLSFCRDAHYTDPKWPDDYWPSSPSPASDADWNATVEAIHRDGEAFAAFTMEADRDLTAKIPHGTGQTYLRTILVSVDHTSYHVGQIIAVRRLLGAWQAA